MTLRSTRRIRALIYSLLLLLISFATTANAQETATEQASQQDDDVLRINVNLVQTDLMVFDKQGHFVDNLQGDQFELRLDGRPQTISFFERVTSGSRREETQLAAARDGKTMRAVAAGPVSDNTTNRGRIIFFFIDDLHLSSDSVVRTRKLLQHFIDDEMGENDQAVIVSPSGKIGFLQQLTDDKMVLHAATLRISYRASGLRLQDAERPPISEFEALSIARNDLDAVSYFTEQTLRENPGIPPNIAEETVRGRARQILEQAAVNTANTLSALRSLVRSSAQLPGRKLVFFISDGLFLDEHTSNAIQRLESITDAAARSGVVIYTMDARGLTSGLADASSSVPADPTGRLFKVDSGELSASQDMMHLLAESTGGRALVNTNALDRSLSRTLSETSTYYLIAWQPDHPEESTNKFRRITLSIKEHPELSVRVRRGFFDAPPKPPASKPLKAKTKEKSEGKPTTTPSPADELRAALGSLYPRTALPTHLSLSYVNTEKEGTVLTASIQLNAESYGMLADALSVSTANVLCVVFNNEGKPVSSLTGQVKFTPAFTLRGQQPRRALTSLQFQLQPGIYQVRVAARDNKSGRIGSSTQWIEIPNIIRGTFALGNLLVAERTVGAPSVQNTAPASEALRLNADHLFARTSYLRFVTFIYNAATRKSSSPDVMLEVKILRDKQPIISLPFKHIEPKGTTDLARIPYAAEVRLGGLTPGHYVLQVTVLDSATKKTATQEFKFTVQ